MLNKISTYEYGEEVKEKINFYRELLLVPDVVLMRGEGRQLISIIYYDNKVAIKTTPTFKYIEDVKTYDLQDVPSDKLEFTPVLRAIGEVTLEKPLILTITTDGKGYHISLTVNLENYMHPFILPIFGSGDTLKHSVEMLVRETISLKEDLKDTNLTGDWEIIKNILGVKDEKN